MSEEMLEVIEKTAPKARKPKTQKVAEESSIAIENIVIEEAKETVNDDGQKIITGQKRSRAPRKSNVHAKEESGAIASHAADIA